MVGADTPTPVVADAHNDLLLELRHRRGEDNPFRARWYEPLRAGGVALQICPVFAQPAHVPERALPEVLGAIAAFERALDLNPDVTRRVTDAADLDGLGSDGRIGLMLAMEGVDAFGTDPTLLDVFWRLGVRMVGLTWSRRNAFADGDAERGSGGLSVAGRELVPALAERGVILDLAHASDQTFEDVLALVPEAAVIISHTACRSLRDSRRNASDEQLRAISQRNGFVGMMAYPPALADDGPTLDSLVDHIEHALGVAGPERVGVGADFFRQAFRSGAWIGPADAAMAGALDSALDGFDGPRGYPTLARRLRERGHQETSVRALLAGNLLDLLARALPAAPARELTVPHPVGTPAAP